MNADLTRCFIWQQWEGQAVKQGTVSEPMPIAMVT